MSDEAPIRFALRKVHAAASPGAEPTAIRCDAVVDDPDAD